MEVIPEEPYQLSALASSVATGDANAFVALVTQLQPRVFRWAVALSGDVDEAEDITQEVFIRVYRAAGTFRGDGPFEAWLYRITRRVLLRMRRKKQSPPEHAGSPLEVYVTDPGARVDRHRAVELIREMAAELPMRQREVFVLCDLEGHTPSEAAQLIGVKDVSVRASLFKARAAIRRSILATHPRFIERHT